MRFFSTIKLLTLINLIMEKTKIIAVLAGGIQQDGELKEITKERVRLGIQTWEQTPNSFLVMSGSWSLLLEQKPKYTEAEAMKAYVIKNGVNEKSVLVEKESKDTIGNAYYIKTCFLTPNKITDIIVITSDFHTKRAEYIFKFVLGNDYNIKIFGSETKNKKEFQKRQIVEKILLNETKVWFKNIKPGDTESIKNFILTLPGYSKKPKISREYLKKLTSLVKY